MIGEISARPRPSRPRPSRCRPPPPRPARDRGDRLGRRRGGRGRRAPDRPRRRRAARHPEAVALGGEAARGRPRRAPDRADLVDRRPDQPAGAQRRDRGRARGRAGRGFAVVADEVRKLAESASVTVVETREAFHGLASSVENVTGRMARRRRRPTRSPRRRGGLAATEQVSASIPADLRGDPGGGRFQRGAVPYGRPPQRPRRPVPQSQRRGWATDRGAGGPPWRVRHRFLAPTRTALCARLGSNRSQAPSLTLGIAGWAPDLSWWQSVRMANRRGSVPEAVETVVIGAGHAGLAASTALAARDLEHVVLEARGSIGQTWRDQRWDSFRLNTPRWMSRLPGDRCRRRRGRLRHGRGVPDGSRTPRPPAAAARAGARR